MNDQQALDLVRDLAQRSREYYAQQLPGARMVPGREREVPEYFPGYRFRVALRDRVRAHAELGHVPERLLHRRHPHLAPEEAGWLRDNWKQTTLPVFQDFKTTIARVFHDPNWDVDWKNTQNERVDNLTLPEYVARLPLWGSLENFWKTVLPDIKLIDANALLVVRPRRVDRVAVTDDEGQEQLVVDSGQALEPVPVLYDCGRVVGEEPGEWYLVEVPERSEVDYGGHVKPYGRIFELYDRDRILRLEQFGRFADHQFRAVEYFRHNWGEVPAWYLGGVTELREGRPHQVPRFRYATDLLDLALLLEQYHNAVLAKCAFPHKIMYGTACDHTWTGANGAQLTCEGGTAYDAQRQGFVPCPACQGTGLRERLSPLGVLLVRPPSAEKQNDAALPQRPLEFVAPDVEVPRLLMEQISLYEHKARKILHLHDSSTRVTGAEQQLATGMLLDEKARMDFMAPEAWQLFYLLEQMLRAINWQRYGRKESEAQPIVTYPTSYDFQTEADYLDQLQVARAAGAPPVVLEQLLRRYLRAIYAGEPDQAAAVETLLAADRLLALSADELVRQRSTGAITPADEVLHASGVNLLTSLARAFVPTEQVKTYWQRPLADRVADLRAAAAAAVPPKAAADRVSAIEALLPTS